MKKWRSGNVRKVKREVEREENKYVQKNIGTKVGRQK